MARYDYLDEHGHMTDTFRPMSCESIECPQCGATARRIISRGVTISHPEADTRGMFRRFTEATQEIDRAATQRESVGETVTTPNLWLASKHRAQAIERAGETKEIARKISSG